MTHATVEMDVSHPRKRVVSAAQTVFLRAGAVVDSIEQMVVAQQREGSEKGGFIDRGEFLLQIGQIEDAGELTVDGAPTEEAHRGDADAGTL